MRQARIKYGVLAVVLLDFLSYLLFLCTSYFRNGEFLSPIDIFFSTELWYWWIIWSALFFFCGYALRKEYEVLLLMVKSRFPEPENKSIIKEAKKEFGMLYAKRLTPFFILLPIAYLAAFSPIPPESSNLLTALLLVIPAIFLIYYRIKNRNK